jgi:hypothetical protein
MCYARVGTWQAFSVETLGQGVMADVDYAAITF